MYTRRFRALPARLAFMTDDTEGGAGAGSETTDAADVADESTVDDTVADPEGADSLGDPGKRALDAMKTKWKDADRLAKQRETELAALRAQVDGREAEHQAEQDAQRVRDEALAAANARVRRSEIKAAAAGKFNDPADAFNYLDLDSFEADEQGDFDTDAINAAIDDLLMRKPYLAAQGGRRFQGGADGGARKETRPPQLSKQDLAGMPPADIATAIADGRLNDALGRK